MSLTYVRRFRMELNLRRAHLPAPVLPLGFYWCAWDPELRSRHARGKYESFRNEIDAELFPCFRSLAGCQRLMDEIAAHKDFVPEATWLVTRECPEAREPVDCGTIQGMAPGRFVGAIQNVGVVPEFRGLGLGRALMLKALRGFAERRLRRVYLEVTAQNRPALALYQSLGFRLSRTMFKPVEREDEPAVTIRIG